MNEIILSNGSHMPRLGQGTWFMGEDRSLESQEIESIQTGIEHGMNLIDTAEMYGDGKAERLVGKAISKYNRSKLYLVSKVYPHNAGRNHIFQSCENSLKRLNTDYLDLYLLHWRGSIRLAETVECMEELVANKKIRQWGVSNFDIGDMEELWSVPDGNNCVVNQVLYHLGSRGIEYALLPWLKKHHVPVMAYSPMAQGGTLKKQLLADPAVLELAKQHQVSPMQILLSFVLHQEGIVAIPKSSNPKHTLENARVADLILTPEERKLLDDQFPAPRHKTYLDMI